jgi:hypothetical protein
MALTYTLYVKICIFQLFFQKKLPGTNTISNEVTQRNGENFAWHQKKTENVQALLFFVSVI